MTTATAAALDAACDAAGVRGTARLVLRVVADFAYGDKDTCWPSNGRIAARVGRSVGHVRRLLATLDRLGLVERRPRADGAGREFLLPWKAGAQGARAGAAPPCPPARAPGCPPARAES